jgi:glycosyltransferase involved in cell wall biosynthesis
VVARLMTLPSVSLVMTTCDGAAHLQEQLDSLAAQTLPAVELIVFDDASTDGTKDILKRFAKACPFPFRAYEQHRRVGFSRNFADAGAQASGELLLFVDQDDIWHPRKVEVIAQAAADGDAGLLTHDLEVFRSDGETILPSFFGHLELQGLPRDVCIKGCALAVRRAFIEQWGWPPAGSGLAHDFWLAFLASAVGDRVFLDDRLIRHRIHDANASGWIPGGDDRSPSLADALAGDPDATLDPMFELFFKPWRRNGIGPLQQALRERASPAQAGAANRAIGKLDVVRGWLRENRARDGQR